MESKYIAILSFFTAFQYINFQKLYLIISQTKFSIDVYINKATAVNTRIKAIILTSILARKDVMIRK